MTGSGGYGENVRDQLLVDDGVATVTDGATYVAAQNFRRDLTGGIDDLFASVDALITPTTPVPAPEFGEVSDIESFVRTFVNTVPFNLTGHPALSVPCGTTGGEPVGLQIVTDRHAEPTAVRLGATVEAAR
jgi:Asp-tRNA(Asn)/Glu-tRNA(Gln) amidotransferase A subunit family amidase